MLLHVDDDVQMTGGTAGDAALALILQPELLAGGDARRNLHRDLPLARDASRAAARRARLRDDAAGAAALRTGPGDGEEALLGANLAVSAALRTRGRGRAGRRARAMTRLAMFVAGNQNAGLGAPR